MTSSEILQNFTVEKLTALYKVLKPLGMFVLIPSPNGGAYQGARKLANGGLVGDVEKFYEINIGVNELCEQGKIRKLPDKHNRLRVFECTGTATGIVAASKSARDENPIGVRPPPTTPETNVIAAVDALDDLEEYSSEYDDLAPTDRDEIRKSRIGQGKFRNELIQHWRVCAVTGLSAQSLLRASHIKPWRDSDNRERLDRFNGLLLAPHLDALFDAGLISFDDSGRILLSTRLSADDRRLLGVNDGFALRSVDQRHKKYLLFHRKKYGLNQ